jgi:hypothetical protein
MIESDVREEARMRAAAQTRLDEIRKNNKPEALLRNKEIFDEVDGIFRPADAKRQEIAELRQRYAKLADPGQPPSPEGPAPASALNRSQPFNPGLRMCSSDEYKRFMDMSRTMPVKDAWLRSSPAEVMSRDEVVASRFGTRPEGLRERAITLTNLPWSDRQPDQFVGLPARKIMLMDLISMATTDSSSIDYVQQTARTDAAAATAYGTLLPEHSLTLINVNVVVSRIGTWTPATEAQLADQGQLQDIINADLLGDFARALENQVVNGSTTPWNGILNASGINTQARGGDTWLDAIHKGMTQIRLAYGEPNALALHPTDLQSVTLQKDAQGNYLFRIGEATNIWGLLTVPTPVFSQGTGLLGDWRYATLWTRQGVSVQASNEYSDYFLRGQVAIKAEGRAAFATKRPSWFCALSGL